jgi:hypothetical protein
LFSKDTIFGESMAKKFAIGDIVTWPELKLDDDLISKDKFKKIGVITQILTVLRSERPVVIAKVLDMSAGKEKDILIISLTLVSKVNKEIQN